MPWKINTWILMTRQFLCFMHFLGTGMKTIFVFVIVIKHNWYSLQYLSRRMMKLIVICLALLMLFLVPILSFVSVNDTEITSIPINRTIGRKSWYNGDWCPIYIPEWWSPKVSRHPFDPYSFVHCQSGVIFFYFCGYPLIWYFGLRKIYRVDMTTLQIV